MQLLEKRLTYIFFKHGISVKHITKKNCNKVDFSSVKFDWNSNPESIRKSMDKFIKSKKNNGILIITSDFRHEGNICVFYFSTENITYCINSIIDTSENITDSVRSAIFNWKNQGNPRGYSFSKSFWNKLMNSPYTYKVAEIKTHKSNLLTTKEIETYHFEYQKERLEKILKKVKN